MSELKRNVLIAEDNEITLLSLSTMFRRGGYEVYTAQTVEQAKRIIETVDGLFAIVADFGFEKSNGISILLTAKKRFPAVKMSIFTAHRDLETRHDVAEFLTKQNLRGKIKFFYKPIESGAFADWLSE